MSKRWSFEDDLFLVAYFDAVGDYIGQHDLGRPKGAATKRVQKLKESGAWDVLKMHADTRLAYRVALDLPLEVDEQEYRHGFRVFENCRVFYWKEHESGSASEVAA
jgi:hypothetical protein